MQHLLEDSLVPLGHALGKIIEQCPLGVVPLPRHRTKGTVRQVYSLSRVRHSATAQYSTYW